MAKQVKTKREPRLKAEVTTAQRLKNILKSCRDIMRKDRGLSGDADRLPMLTWLMFLKFLDDKEASFRDEAAFNNRPYLETIEQPYRWRDWAADTKLSGSDLMNFINQQKTIFADNTEGVGLFAYLCGLEHSELPRRRVVGAVFKGVLNRMVSGYLLREVIDKINQIQFNSSDDIHTLSLLYEGLLKEMRDASGDAGEFYTPRPVVKFMVNTLAPRIGETILDPACGTGGFLVQAFEFLTHTDDGRNPKNFQTLHNNTFSGNEVKPLPYLLCQMNLLLHGLENPHIKDENSLKKRLGEIGDADRVDIIITNPPFGGEEERQIIDNFPDGFQTAETTLLFIQVILRRLRRANPDTGLRGGRAAIVVPNGTLFDEGIAAKIKRDLTDDFNLHTVVRLPEGVFAPYTDIPSNLLFFEHGQPTDKIWFYEQRPPLGRKKYSKMKAIQDDDFEELNAWWSNRTENDQAWQLDLTAIKAHAKAEAQPFVDSADAARKRTQANRRKLDALKKQFSSVQEARKEPKFIALEAAISEDERTENDNNKKAERLRATAYNLDAKNPNRKPEVEYKDPSVLVNLILDNEQHILKLLKN